MNTIYKLSGLLALSIILPSVGYAQIAPPGNLQNIAPLVIATTGTAVCFPSQPLKTAWP